MKKIIALCLLLYIVLNCLEEAQATELQDEPHYLVSIPKRIVLDVETKSSDYTISASSDMPRNYQLNIIPDESFIMTDTAENQVTAVVSQEETIWSYEDIQNQRSKTGNVEAQDLFTGDWEGTLNFAISFTDLCKEQHQQLVQDGAVAATCSRTGLTEGEHCELCGEVTMAQEIVEARGHSHKGDFITVNGVTYATVSGGCYTKATTFSNSCTAQYVKVGDYSNGPFQAGSVGMGCPFCYAGTITNIVTRDYMITHSACGKSTEYTKLQYWMNYCSGCNLVTWSNFATNYAGSYIPEFIFIENHNYNKVYYAFTCDQ